MDLNWLGCFVVRSWLTIQSIQRAKGSRTYLRYRRDRRQTGEWSRQPTTVVEDGARIWLPRNSLLGHTLIIMKVCTIYSTNNFTTLTRSRRSERTNNFTTRHWLDSQFRLPACTWTDFFRDRQIFSGIDRFFPGSFFVNKKTDVSRDTMSTMLINILWRPKYASRLLLLSILSDTVLSFCYFVHVAWIMHFKMSEVSRSWKN